MKKVLCLLFATSFLAACRMGGDQLESFPPVVIGTFPAAGTLVDPSLTRLKIAFSKGMAKNSYSLCIQDKKLFPKIDGAPKFALDGKSCLIKVVLKPGKIYAVWINSANSANFKEIGRASCRERV